jgi:cytochrome c peroxidase
MCVRSIEKEMSMKTRTLVAAVLSLALPAVWTSVGAAEPIEAIPAAKPKNPAMVELGKKLYFDPRLSKSGFISCNSCHNLSMGGHRQPANFHRP